MAVAVIAGMDYRPLLESDDPVTVLAHRMVAERVTELREAVAEARIHKMANEVARRFTG